MAGFLRGCFVGIFLVSSIAANASTRTVYAEPGDFTRAYVPGANGQSHVDSRNWNADVYTRQGSSSTAVQTNRGYSWNSFKNVAKGAVKGGVAGILGTAALGYLIDQIPDACTFNNSLSICTPPYYPGGGTAYSRWRRTVFSRPQYYADPVAACKAFGSTYNVVEESWKDTWSYVNCRNSQGTNHQIDNAPCSTSAGPFNPSSKLCDLTFVPPSTVYTPFTDSNWDDLFNNSPSIPQAYIPPFVDTIDGSPYAFSNPDTYEFSGPSSIEGQPTITTSTNPSTGSTTVTESLPSTQLEYGTDPLSITTTDVTVTNTYTDGTVTNTSTTTNYSSNPTTTTPQAPVEVPTDCAFMPTVCEFIDWVKTPFEEDEPDFSELLTDEDFEKTVNFSSSASCPSPTVISTSRGSYEFDWQPACTWAGMIKTLVLIAALIGAIYINLGLFRGGD